MIDAPGLVEGRKNVALNNLIANIAKVPKQLMVMGLTVSKALSFIVAVTQKRFLTLCTHKMLYMPMLSKCSDDPFLNWSPTSSTDGNSHFVVATKAVKFVQFICSIAWSCTNLSGT